MLNLEKQNITGILKEFESPIGKLTVGFDHVILIFPLLLISGFVFCLSILTDANATRKILLNNYKIGQEHISEQIKNKSTGKIKKRYFSYFYGYNKKYKSYSSICPFIYFRYFMCSYCIELD